MSDLTLTAPPMREDEYIAAHVPALAAALAVATHAANAANAALRLAEAACNSADADARRAYRAASAEARTHFAEHHRPANEVPLALIERIADSVGARWRDRNSVLMDWTFVVSGGIHRDRLAVCITPMCVAVSRHLLVWWPDGPKCSIYLDTGGEVGSIQRKRRVSIDDCEALARIAGVGQ